MSLAVYPGSFDPVTYGHLDVVRRAAGIFDRLVIAVLVNPRKAPLLPADERAAAIREAIMAEMPEIAPLIDVATFDGLTVDFCRAVGASHLVRGLRAVSDFEAELQMAHMNRALAPGVDTVFLMTAVEYAFLSSALVREIAQFGGDVTPFVPASVAVRLRRLAQEGNEPLAR
ncbi:MAG: pantetheine-phosphate adenylyltransferase [Chloroflexi bacterium]|nr:pantetheine-phosphate adenylyltransferase [Chloroflexota bacterium]